MPANAYHHIALRVSDIERGGAFYVDVFDGHWQTKPATYEGAFAAMVVGGIPDARFRVCQIGFATGVIELFEFLEPVVPTELIPAPRNQLLHFCLQVDDVAVTLARAEASGGKRFWPQVYEIFPGIHVTYISDPDGNVIELASSPIADVVAGMIAADPSLAPDSSIA